MANDIFRSPMDPLHLFTEWWGEPLSQELYDRAVAAPEKQQYEFLNFVDNSAPANMPDLTRGEIRPLLINDGVNFSALGDYFSAASTLALYVDEVAVEYTFGQSPPELKVLLHYLLLLKPLAEEGAIRFLKPHTDRHNEIDFRVAWSEFREALVLDDSEKSRLLESIKKFFPPPGGVRLSSQLVNFLVASQLSAKAAMPGKINLLGRNEPEMLLFDVFARASRTGPVDMRGYEMARLIGLRVPLYLLNIPALAKVRLSEPIFAEWREATRRALNNIEGLPDGSAQWQDRAREIAAGELLPLERRIERGAQISPTLTEAKSGLKMIGFSAVGAAAGAALGADFKSALAGASATGVAQVASEYWNAVKQRNKLMIVKDLIMAFTRSSA